LRRACETRGVARRDRAGSPPPQCEDEMKRIWVCLKCGLIGCRDHGLLVVKKGGKRAKRALGTYLRNLRHPLRA
jgi:uncharacterized UBP type Zn finger protein